MGVLRRRSLTSYPECCVTVMCTLLQHASSNSEKKHLLYFIYICKICSVMVM